MIGIWKQYCSRKQLDLLKVQENETPFILLPDKNRNMNKELKAQINRTALHIYKESWQPELSASAYMEGAKEMYKIISPLIEKAYQAGAMDSACDEANFNLYIHHNPIR